MNLSIAFIRQIPYRANSSEGNRLLRRRANLQSKDVDEKKGRKRGRPPREGETTTLTIDVEPELAIRFRRKAKKVKGRTHEEYLRYLLDIDKP